MVNLLRKAIEKKRVFLINKLISENEYTDLDTHLFEWTLTELEEEYNKIRNTIQKNKKN